MSETRRVPVIHTTCGGQVGWYLRDSPRTPDIVRAEDFERMDRSKPENGEPFREVCPVCGRRLLGYPDMKRVFQ